MFKLCLAVFICVLSTHKSWAHEQDDPIIKVPVYAMEETELQGVFDLQSSQEYTAVELDCLSFIHGLNFYEPKADELRLSYSFILSEPECREIFNFIKSGLEDDSPLCIELNLVEKTYELTKRDESCRLGL